MGALLHEHGMDLYVRYPFTRAGDDEGLRQDLLSLARFLSREASYRVDYSSCEYGSVKVNVEYLLALANSASRPISPSRIELVITPDSTAACI